MHSCGLSITHYIVGLNDEILLRQWLCFRFEKHVELFDEMSEFFGLSHICLGNMRTGKTDSQLIRVLYVCSQISDSCFENSQLNVYYLLFQVSHTEGQ